MPPKGEFEVVYGGPWAGLDYSKPINLLDPNALAPGSTNWQIINGMLCSSPGVAPCYPALPTTQGEFVIGIHEVPTTTDGLGTPYNATFIVTTVAVYITNGTQFGPGAVPPVKLHTWTGSEIFSNFVSPGVTCSFVDVMMGPAAIPTVFFTSSCLQGVFSWNGTTGVQLATNYVCGDYICLLGGRLFVAQCNFPTGGGPFGGTQPTVAWSGVGLFSGAGTSDPWNPANFNNLQGNVGGFQLLTSCGAYISGIAVAGRSAFIGHPNGVIEVDPGPSGIQPYIAYDLWNSKPGMGVMKNTMAQYGTTIIFRAPDNVYMLSLSSGLSPIGQKIIAKMNSDRKTLELQFGFNSTGTTSVQANGYWYLSSIVEMDGELHYLLTVNGNPYANSGVGGNLQITPVCNVYDYNLSSNAWTFWDMTLYFNGTSVNPGFTAMTYPVTKINTGYIQTTAGVVTISTPQSFTFGALTAVFPLPGGPVGNLFQLIPYDYDGQDSISPTFWQPFYTQTAIPISTVAFRAETIALGHRITLRRVRIQADNAPNNISTNQIASLNMTGSTSAAPSTQILMNPITSGMRMATYYGDTYLTDDMIQVTMTSIGPTFCTFRISTVSIIGIDSEGTTR